MIVLLLSVFEHPGALALPGLEQPVPAHPAAGASKPAIPHVGQRALEDYRTYLAAQSHRAFAIAPGGTWAWVAGEASSQAAADSAAARCSARTEQKCVLFDVDGQVVFAQEDWKRLWGPYKPASMAVQSPEGVQVGQRFPDLVLEARDGTRSRLSESHGKVRILYFWASWCGICRRELPKLLKFSGELRSRSDAAVLLLPLREDFSDTQHWLAENGLADIPLLRPRFAAAGTTADDTGDPPQTGELTRVVPVIFVLDKHGIVLFAHRGSIRDWSEYLPLIDDARNRSGA